MNNIDRLNQTITIREKMINDIIYWKHNPKNDAQWDKLGKTYNQKSFLWLRTLHNKIKGK